MKKLVIALAVVSIVVVSCGPKQLDYAKIFDNPDTYCKSVYELNSVVMGNNFPPMVASRNYMYACVAGYEVMAAGDTAEYTSLSGQLHGLTGVPKAPAGVKIDFGFASLLAFWKLGVAVTFSDNETKNYVDSLKQLAKDHGMPEDIFNNSVAFADTVGNVVMNWSRKDHYKETRGMPEFTVYPDSPARWVPTPPAYFPAAEPHWEMIRTLVLDSLDEFAPPVVLPFNVKDKNSAYYKELMKVKTATDSLNEEQRHIANFWDDNPFKLNVSGHLMFGTKKFSPPGHWMSIVGIAAKQAKANYNQTVYAFAKTAMAFFDGFIQCWHIKYKYNAVRPETVINKYFDANWRPTLQTPAFPEYSCGHCTISAASAEALTSVFGDNFAFTDTTELEFGIANRSFKSFRAAAVENEAARFYGGIHYDYSCHMANKCGQAIGALIVQRLHMKK